MRKRLDAGTDVAMIGAWDASRDSMPLRDGRTAVVETDAADGHLFVIRLEGDGGGAVDVYVDEDVPDDARTILKAVGDERLLLLPTGTLQVDGVEYYRNPVAARKGPDGAIPVPPGTYAVSCLLPVDEERTPRSEEELAALVGHEELRHYDRTNARGCLFASLTLLLFPVLVLPLGWIAALAITVVAFVASFHVLERILKRRPRYARLHAIVPAFRIGRQDPAIVLVLRRVAEPLGLEGRSVRTAER